MLCWPNLADTGMVPTQLFGLWQSDGQRPR